MVYSNDHLQSYIAETMKTMCCHMISPNENMIYLNSQTALQHNKPATKHDTNVLKLYLFRRPQDTMYISIRKNYCNTDNYLLQTL